MQAFFNGQNANKDIPDFGNPLYFWNNTDFVSYNEIFQAGNL